MKPLNLSELEILDVLKKIKYGYVQFTIHNGEIVQIDKTEKIRLDGQKVKAKGGSEQK